MPLGDDFDLTEEKIKQKYIPSARVEHHKRSNTC